MKNAVWSVKIRDINSRLEKVVRSVTVVDPDDSQVEEFKIWLDRKFGKDRIVDFKRT